MGARGPKPIPSAAKKLAGTYRADRAPRHEAAPIGKPTCPTWLEGDARAEFRRLVRLLSEMGLIGRIDGNALARYAVLWVRWREAERAIRNDGGVFTIKDDKGNVKYVQQSPHVAIARTLAEQLLKIEQSFGMSPSSRSRIEASPPREGDELGDFLNNGPTLRLTQSA